MVLKNTCLNACHTLRKNAHAPVHTHLFNGAEISLPHAPVHTRLFNDAETCLPKEKKIAGNGQTA